MSGIQVGWGSQWETLANAINDWYGGGVSSAQYQQVVQMLNSGEYTMEQMEGILQQIPDFSTTYNASGKLTSVSYKAQNAATSAATQAATEINSNVAQAANSQFQTVQTVTKNAQTGKVTVSDTVTKYNSGTATSAKAVASSAVAAVAAASVGITLGKVIDSALYNVNPDFWDDHGMSSLNPETWGDITAGENGFFEPLFNFVFQIDPSTGNPQAYLDEKTFAYMVAYMIDKGVYGGGGAVPTPYIGGVGAHITTDDLWTMTAGEFVSRYMLPTARSDFSESELAINFFDGTYQNYIHSDDVGVLVHNNDNFWWYKIDPNSTQDVVITSIENGVYTTSTHYGTEHGTIYAYNNDGTGISTLFSYNNNAQSTAKFINVSDFPSSNFGAYIGSISYQDVAGITDQEGATQFDASSVIDPTDIAAILALLQTQFPDLWDNRMEISPNGDDIIKYIPVGFPTGGTGSQVTTIGATQSDLAPNISDDGENVTDELIKTLIDMLQYPLEQNGMESNTNTPTEPVDPNASDMGSGVTPPFVIPTGSASALYSVYNPSQAQLNSLGAWLWSSNFVDQLLKLFNDPMQAIIGLHKIFATPPTSGTGTIKVGYLDSGVGSNLVGAQYTEIDCGNVNLQEYFKNALDYTHTDIYIYLPFVGIVPLNVVDVMRAKINVKYKVDVLTGACLATINVFRDSNAGGQLYTYAGNCAVQYPLSSGSYMGIVASALGIAGSIAGTVLSGGAMLPMALGVGASALNGAKTRVEHGGALSGNAGAMGIKKPYLIIRRPQTKIADNFNIMDGISNNVYGMLSGYTGFTRVKYVHLENIPATDNELTQIEELLKSGVLI